VETFGAAFPLVGREAAAQQLLSSTSSRFQSFQQKKHDNKLHPIPNCVGGPGVGKSRINQHGLDMMREAAAKSQDPLLPLLTSAYSINIAYGNGMAPSEVDKHFGGEVGLALRLLYRAFAEQESIAFVDWLNRFDVNPASLTLSVAVSVLRIGHEKVVPAGQLAFMYIGVDEFNSIARMKDAAGNSVLDSVVRAIGKAMSTPPPFTFVVGMLTGTASEALSEAFDSSQHLAVRLAANLLSLTEAEKVVEKVSALGSWRLSRGFRRCLAGQSFLQLHSHARTFSAPAAHG
jgi:hypothetical protein